MSAKTAARLTPTPTSLTVSVAATAAGILVLVGVLAALSVGLVALAEPVAMGAALADGVAYLWSLLVGAVS